MDSKGDLFIQNPNWEDHQKEFHHSSFFAGGDVAFAGKMSVNNGYVELITNSSGHYAPNPEMVDQVISTLNLHYSVYYDYWVDQLFTSRKISHFKDQDIRFSRSKSETNLHPISFFKRQNIGNSPRAAWICCEWGDKDKSYDYRSSPRPIRGNQFQGF